MKKINLINTLKKTFNKKAKVKKKKIVKKITKKPVSNKSKIVKQKIIKKKKKNISKNIEKKVNNETNQNLLRIPKNNEQKPEIKKVKKQQTEKRLYKIKDYVVYPKHGVGQIQEFKKMNIGGIDIETYVLKFEKDKANGMVPVNKQNHLRPLATINLSLIHI